MPVRASQEHQYFHHPGTADSLQPQQPRHHGDMHQKEPTAHCTSRWSDSGSEDVIGIKNATETKIIILQRSTIEGFDNGIQCFSWDAAMSFGQHVDPPAAFVSFPQLEELPRLRTSTQTRHKMYIGHCNHIFTECTNCVVCHSSFLKLNVQTMTNQKLKSEPHFPAAAWAGRQVQITSQGDNYIVMPNRCTEHILHQHFTRSPSQMSRGEVGVMSWTSWQFIAGSHRKDFGQGTDPTTMFLWPTPNHDCPIWHVGDHHNLHICFKMC